MSRVLKLVHLQQFLNNYEPQNSQHSGQGMLSIIHFGHKMEINNFLYKKRNTKENNQEARCIG